MKPLRPLCGLVFVLLLATAVHGDQVALGIRPILGVAMPEKNIVESVIPGSLAETMQLQKGDRVVAVNGRPVAGVDDVRSALRELQLGATLELEIVRDGKRLKRSAPYVAPKNPFREFVITEGTGLSGQLEVGQSESDATAVGLSPPVGEQVYDYSLYPSPRWAHLKGRGVVLRADALGVAAGFLDGKADWVSIAYPMVARTSAGLTTLSTRADVVSTYGRPASTLEDKPGAWYNYPSRGISVSVMGDKVLRILVYKPVQ